MSRSMVLLASTAALGLIVSAAAEPTFDAAIAARSSRLLGTAPNTMKADGSVVVLVGAAIEPSAASSLDEFSRSFGLRKADFTLVPAARARRGSDDDAALADTIDLEMVHLNAPAAKIYFVEAASNDRGGIDAAIGTAYKIVLGEGGGVISLTESVRASVDRSKDDRDPAQGAARDGTPSVRFASYPGGWRVRTSATP